MDMLARIGRKKYQFTAQSECHEFIPGAHGFDASFCSAASSGSSDLAALQQRTLQRAVWPAHAPVPLRFSQCAMPLLPVIHTFDACPVSCLRCMSPCSTLFYCFLCFARFPSVSAGSLCCKLVLALPDFKPTQAQARAVLAALLEGQIVQHNLACLAS